MINKQIIQGLLTKSTPLREPMAPVVRPEEGRELLVSRTFLNQIIRNASVRFSLTSRVCPSEN